MILSAALTLLAQPAEPPLVQPELSLEALAPRRTSLIDFAEDDEDEGRTMLRYTYLELGYQTTEIDELGEDADGLRGRASLGLLGFLYVFGDYRNSSTDITDTDTDSFSLGVGGHFGLTKSLDLLGEGAWLYSDTDGFDADNGWTAFAGARWLAVPWYKGGLEINGGFRWIDIANVYSDDTNGAWELGGRVHFLTMLSVGARYTFLENSDSTWTVDARIAF